MLQAIYYSPLYKLLGGALHLKINKYTLAIHWWQTATSLLMLQSLILFRHVSQKKMASTHAQYSAMCWNGQWQRIGRDISQVHLQNIQRYIDPYGISYRHSWHNSYLAKTKSRGGSLNTYAMAIICTNFTTDFISTQHTIIRPARSYLDNTQL